MKQTESILDTDTETFIDEDGKYGEPGTEYVFHPESTPNGEPKQKEPDTILRTSTKDEDDEGTEQSDQGLQEESLSRAYANWSLSGSPSVPSSLAIRISQSRRSKPSATGT